MFGFGTKPDLGRALALYFGYDVEPQPREDFDRVEKSLGKKRADKVKPELDAVLRVLGGLRPDWSRHSLDEAAHWAADEIQARFPDLDGKGRATIVWVASYGWK